MITIDRRGDLSPNISKRWGERRRAEGHEAPDVAPLEYWADRAKFRDEENARGRH
jgi:hypothetical protein